MIFPTNTIPGFSQWSPSPAPPRLATKDLKAAARTPHPAGKSKAKAKSEPKQKAAPKKRAGEGETSATPGKRSK